MEKTHKPRGEKKMHSKKGITLKPEWHEGFDLKYSGSPGHGTSYRVNKSVIKPNTQPKRGEKAILPKPEASPSRT
jgi:hypothetical protein